MPAMLERNVYINSILNNALAKHLFKARVDTLWRMLFLEQQGNLPGPFEEGATGRFDNKGGIFIPGGFVIEDSDKRLLRDTGEKPLKSEDFIQDISQSLNFDNATLIYPNSVVRGINLPNGFFIEKSAQILAIESIFSSSDLEKPIKYFSDNITMQTTPEFILPPFGTRTKVTSCLGVCISHPRLYYLECMAQFGVRLLAQEGTWENFITSLEPVVSNTGEVLASPNVVVLHDTRYKKENYVGITRFLALRDLGDFAVLTFEKISKELVNELAISESTIDSTHTVAKYKDTTVVSVLRVYKGKGVKTYVVSPGNDLGLDLKPIKNAAKDFYLKHI
jgi:hypothetical protein